MSALMKAAGHGHVDVVRLLMEAGASKNLETRVCPYSSGLHTCVHSYSSTTHVYFIACSRIWF